MSYTVLSVFDFPPAGLLQPGTTVCLSSDQADPLLEAGFIVPKPVAETA